LYTAAVLENIRFFKLFFFIAWIKFLVAITLFEKYLFLSIVSSTKDCAAK